MDLGAPRHPYSRPPHHATSAPKSNSNEAPTFKFKWGAPFQIQVNNNFISNSSGQQLHPHFNFKWKTTSTTLPSSWWPNSAIFLDFWASKVFEMSLGVYKRLLISLVKKKILMNGISFLVLLSSCEKTSIECPCEKVGVRP